MAEQSGQGSGRPDLGGQGIGFTVRFRDLASPAINSGKTAYASLMGVFKEFGKTLVSYKDRVTEMFTSIGRKSEQYPDIIIPGYIKTGKIQEHRSFYRLILDFFDRYTERARALIPTTSDLGGRLKSLRDEFKKLGESEDESGKKLHGLRNIFMDLRRLRYALGELVVAGKSVEEAGNLERALAHVSIQMGQNHKQFEQMQDDILLMSSNMQVSHYDISRVVTSLGQMNEKWNDNTKNLTIFAIKLSEINNLSREAAGDFAAIAHSLLGFKTPRELEQLGSLISQTAIESRLTGSAIVDMLQQGKDTFKSLIRDAVDYQNQMTDNKMTTEQLERATQNMGKNLTEQFLAAQAAMNKIPLFSDPERIFKLMDDLKSRTSQAYIGLSTVILASGKSAAQELEEMLRAGDITGFTMKLGEAADILREKWDPKLLPNLQEYFGRSKDELRDFSDASKLLPAIAQRIHIIAGQGKLFDEQWTRLRGTWLGIIDRAKALGQALAVYVGNPLIQMIYFTTKWIIPIQGLVYVLTELNRATKGVFGQMAGGVIAAGVFLGIMTKLYQYSDLLYKGLRFLFGIFVPNLGIIKALLAIIISPLGLAGLIIALTGSYFWLKKHPEAWELFVEGMKGAKNYIADFADWLPNKLFEIGKSIGASAVDWGKGFVMGIVNGIDEAIDAIKEGWAEFHWSDIIVVPFKSAFYDIVELIRNFNWGEGIFDGLVAAWNKVWHDMYENLIPDWMKTKTNVMAPPPPTVNEYARNIAPLNPTRNFTPSALLSPMATEKIPTVKEWVIANPSMMPKEEIPIVEHRELNSEKIPAKSQIPPMAFNQPTDEGKIVPVSVKSPDVNVDMASVVQAIEALHQFFSGRLSAIETLGNRRRVEDPLMWQLARYDI